MTNQPFSFLHAADLHLERPVTGLAECPEHLLEGVLSAAQRAAERLFHTAITEKVDFVLLCGDILSLRQTGPWGAVFLLDQFERLRREGIAVYWIGGFADPPSEWPEVLALPDNVTLFPEDEVTGVIHRKGTDAVARILGTSRGKNNTALRLGDFAADPDGFYTIGMMRDYGSYDTLRACGPHYWALGGTHRRDTSVQGHVTIHNPGATLARRPEDGDAVGASLVTVDETGRTVIKPVKTSPVSWTTERLVFRDEQDEEFIASAMRTRLAALRKSMGDEILFVAWVFEVPAALATELRYGNLSQSLLRGVRADFGREAPLIWSTKIDPVALDDEGDEGERQTILGDYLRMIRFYKENPGDNIPLS
ncbi:MAG: metallophosphoesterase, partial [Thermoguttaceae bacterium]|nr:metallophosphoesterase [Thermoguttaceae bacterium]